MLDSVPKLLGVFVVKFGLIGCFLCSSLMAQVPPAYVGEIPHASVRFEMRGVPAGTHTQSDGKKIKVPAFWMSAKELTYDEYQLFFEEEKDPAPKPDAISRPSPPYIDFTLGMGKVGGYPANSMQQYAAIMYCKWLYKKTKQFYRLPTEVEWEYACQLGKTESNLSQAAWLAQNSEDKYHRVGEKPANALGFYDLFGNVAEWVLDQDGPAIRAPKDGSEPIYVSKEAAAIVKGGHYASQAKELSCAWRQPADPVWNQRDPQIPKSKWWNADAPFVGFRLVRPLKTPTETEINAFFDQYLNDL